MKKTMLILSIFLAGCATQGMQSFYGTNGCPYYYAEITCARQQSVTSFYNHLTGDLKTAEDNEARQIRILNSVQSANDETKIEAALNVVVDTAKLLPFYGGRDQLLRENYLNAYEAASEAYGDIEGSIASMKLNLCDVFARISQKDLAKKCYREVVMKYTGLAYRSYVKRAEFGLEDLREK